MSSFHSSPLSSALFFQHVFPLPFTFQRYSNNYPTHASILVLSSVLPHSFLTSPPRLSVIPFPSSSLRALPYHLFHFSHLCYVSFLSLSHKKTFLSFLRVIFVLWLVLPQTMRKSTWTTADGVSAGTVGGTVTGPLQQFTEDTGALCLSCLAIYWESLMKGIPVAGICSLSWDTGWLMIRMLLRCMSPLPHVTWFTGSTTSANHHGYLTVQDLFVE